jgi:uncharacterized protein YwgA
MLRISPLDRIHMMKVLFLLQRRAGEIPDYFNFEPYFYGPCSLEVYDVLAALERGGLIVRPLHPIMSCRIVYYLTERGKKEAEKAARALDPLLREHLEALTMEVSQQGRSLERIFGWWKMKLVSCERSIRADVDVEVDNVG